MKIPDPIREVIRNNLEKLIAHHQKLNHHSTIRGSAKIGGGTIGGLLTGTRATTIDNVAKTAKAFGLEPWQLLVPNLDPENLPRLFDKSEEKALFSHISQKIHLIQQEIAQYDVDKK